MYHHALLLPLPVQPRIKLLVLAQRIGDAEPSNSVATFLQIQTLPRAF